METVDKEGRYVENLENRPRNILEEIVWYKDTEIAEVLLLREILLNSRLLPPVGLREPCGAS